MSRFGKEQAERIFTKIRENPEEALNLFREFEAKYQADPAFREDSGGYLIDIGDALRDEMLVRQGMDAIQRVFPSVSDEKSRAFLLYQLGNGYHSLHMVSAKKHGFAFNPDSTPLVKAKECYRAILPTLRQLKEELQASVLINYGNCLSNLGRSVEALNEYYMALRISPKYSMALGNLGIELERYAYIANDVEVLRYAKKVLEEAIESDNLGLLGPSYARDVFRRSKERIEEMLSKVASKTVRKKAEKSSPEPREKRAYIDFCQQYGLFLNLRLKDIAYEHIPGDTISFSLVTDLGDETTFPRLARILNEVKERYAAARWLVFEACKSSADLQPYDEITYYLDNLDYAVYGIRAAKLKLAFETTYNILDKIAFFINDYLGLKMKDHQIHFRTIWKQGKESQGCLKPVLLQRNNYHLYALYDVSCDFKEGGYYYSLRDIRNRLTHRYVVLHTERLRWLESADGPEFHLDYADLVVRTLNLLKLVRAAVIYLIAFVDQEERKKRGKKKGYVMTRPVSRISPLDIPPGRLHT